VEIAASGIAGQCGAHGNRDFVLGEALVSAPLIIFFVLAVMAVLGAISLILQKHPIHSALSLIVVMVALAGLYLLMGAEFVAAVQIIVYGGAIMVLFVFVIMLLNAGVEERTNFSKMASLAGLPLTIALLGFLAAAVARSSDTVQAATQTGATAPTKQIAGLLFQEFVYPFELTSFLILVAILGAIVLAQREKI
jgi:NADH-quinone oxidoreductase subunit J